MQNVLNTKIGVKNVIFDLDGTLIDSAFDVIRLLINVINQNGGELSQNTRIKIGPPLIDMIKTVAPDFSDEIIQKIMDEFRIAYEHDDLEKTVPFEGIIELLNELKSKNINVFIATYKPKHLAMSILNRHFNGLYKDIVTPSEIENFADGKTKTDILRLLMSKWEINPSEAVMVGDAKSDITCAKEAGIMTIGALFGYGDVTEFKLADERVNTTKDLSDIIKKII